MVAFLLMPAARPMIIIKSTTKETTAVMFRPSAICPLLLAAARSPLAAASLACNTCGSHEDHMQVTWITCRSHEDHMPVTSTCPASCTYRGGQKDGRYGAQKCPPSATEEAEEGEDNGGSVVIVTNWCDHCCSHSRLWLHHNHCSVWLVA